jgi:hypothetical protein
MTKESLKLALESAYLAGFNASGEGYNGEYPFGDKNQNPEQDAVWIKDRDNALRERLAQPEQEPVAWGVFDGPNLHDMFFAEEDAKDMARLKGVGSVVRPLTTPPAALSQAGDRKALAEWMMAQGYATGHGDTIEQLLEELRWQVEERGQDAP